MTLDPAQLPREFPRRFVPEDIDVSEWGDLEPLFDDLERRPLSTAADLERMILDLSELTAVVYEDGAIRRIRMTCDTSNPEHEKAYLHFVENIEPRLKPRYHRLRQRFVDSPARARLDHERYMVLARSFENAVQIFREENVPLEVEDQKLGQRYQKVTGAMTVEFDGKEQTLQQMARYLEEPDRDVRRAAWEKVAERRLQDRRELDELYDQLVRLRERQARNAGFVNFRDYAFRKRERFDYTPDDCARFHRGVEEHIVPLMRALQKQRKEKLGVRTLRPWDLVVDPEGRPPLRPFSMANELVRGCREIFATVDPDLGRQFGLMADLGLLDLESRKGKAPGGYQSTLSERRLPFIFMNAVGRDRDLRTLLHEGGHAFHTFATREEPIHAYRHAPLEFAEVASMAMEFLGAPCLEVFYSRADADRAREDHLLSIVDLFCWIATIDAFQHWIYTHPGHTQQERQREWLALRRRFGGIEDWTGYEEALATDWQRQLHLYLHPFYYIEYGIAQLGALGIWLAAQKDRSGAVRAYRQALALGGSRPLPDLFQAAGLPFDFGPDALGRAAAGLRQALWR